MSMWKKHTRTQRCPLLVWLDSRLMCSSMTLRRESRISVCVSLYSELLLIARLDRHAAVRRIIITTHFSEGATAARLKRYNLSV